MHVQAVSKTFASPTEAARTLLSQHVDADEPLSLVALALDEIGGVGA